MDYPIDTALMRQMVAARVAAEPLGAGSVPGFTRASRTQPGAYRIGERAEFSFQIDAIQALAAESIHELLDEQAIDAFLRATSSRVLSMMTEVDPVSYFPRWDYDAIVAALGVPVGVLFPRWREESRSLPALPVSCRGSHAVPDDQVLWMLGGACCFVANDQPAVQQNGSTTRVTLAADVWAVERPTARFARVVLVDASLTLP